MEQRLHPSAGPPHVLYLMRHARAEVVRPGDEDHQRELTEHGHRQAHAVGAWLAELGEQVDRVLCSEAARTRQTLAGLDLGADTEYLWELYNAGADRILDQLRRLDESVVTAMVVGHAPGVPALTWDLVEPVGSDQTARATIAHHFPPATVVRLEFTGPWRALERARLTHARVD